MIYYDPSESRDGSRLDGAVVEAGEAVAGLEAVTGADLLVTAQELPVLDATKGPGRLALLSACRAGILVQRKSGSDLLGSIPNLGSIAARMNACEPLASYLVVDGLFEMTGDGYVMCNGRGTHWSYNAYVGALDAWQIYGGFVMSFWNGIGAARWILHRNKSIQKMMLDKPKLVSAKSRKQTQSLLIDPNPQRGVLEAFPHVGEVGSAAILDYCGTLAWSLVWLADPEATMDGMGMSKKTAWRAYLGLRDNEQFCICLNDGTALSYGEVRE